MKPVTLLAELQNVDTRSDENAVVRAALEKRLADASAVRAAQSALDASDRRAGDLKAQLRALELETEGLTDKLKQINERLYSGRITNAKELASLNEDERMLQRRKSELEDRELALMEQIEAAEKELEAERAGYAVLSANANALKEHTRTALGELDASDADLLRKREALRAQIPAEALRVYGDLRRTKKGRAVAHIKNAACVACGYAVPSSLISRAKLGDELVFCTNCGRVLVP